MRPHLRTIYILALLLLCAKDAYAIDDLREFRIINASNGLADNNVQTITSTKTGRMFITTIGNLNFFDGSRYTHIDTDQKYQYHLPLYHGGERLYFDNNSHLWMKNTNTVTCVDLKQERFVESVGDMLTREFGFEYQAKDLFVDSLGVVWLLTEKGLYNTKSRQIYPVARNYNLQDLDVYDNLLLLFYDNGEEVGINLKTGLVDHRTRAYDWNEAQKYMRSSQIMHYGDGFFQIRNGDGGAVLLYLDMKNCQWKKVLELDYHLNSLALHEGCLYLASSRGYWIYSMETGETLHVESLHLSGSGRELKTDCNTLAFDKQGGMWIGTECRGLFYAHPNISPFTSYPLASPVAQKYESMMRGMDEYVGEFRGLHTNCKYKDSRGWTWFGTVKGLYLYRSPQSDPVVFTKKNGLLNNVIHAIVEDQDHVIWASTSYGISCILFDGDDPVLVNSYNANDNVPNESFVDSKAMCLDDGTIIMQSIEHMVVFHPRNFRLSISRKLLPLNPKLVRLMVNGTYVEAGEERDGNVILDRAITRVSDIVLNADQNTVSLTFSGLNYFRPLQTYYRVKVSGLLDEWKVFSYYNSDGIVDGRGMLHLPLIGLEPGTYQISVQASLFPDVWPDEEPSTWTVYVNQPWWQSMGVYLVLGLLVLVMAIVNFVAYNKNTRKRTRLNSEEGDIIRKICSFTEHCDEFLNNPFEPSTEDAYNGEKNQFTPAFITEMTKLLPYVREHKGGPLTMHRLSKVAGVDVAHLYDTLSGQIYKSPRNLARHILLERGAELLRTTDKTVEEISDECGFYTPNFFIGNFYHQYKMTPTEYRQEA